MAFEDVLAATTLRLPPRESRVLTCLAWHKNGRTGDCFPSVETIAAWCELSPASVKAGTAELVKRGYLIKRRGQNRVSYVLQLASPESSPAELASPESSPQIARIQPSDSQNLAPNQGSNQGTEPKQKAPPAPRLVLELLPVDLQKSPTEPEQLNALVERVWSYWLGKTSGKAVFSEQRRRQALSRARERLQLAKGNWEAAETDMLQAVDGVFASDWHQEHKDFRWEIIFRSVEAFEHKLRLGARPARPAVGMSALERHRRSA